MSDLQKLIGKALSDEQFVEQLLSDPEAVLQENGVEPTPEMLEALHDIDADGLRKLVSAFGDDGKAA